MKIKRVCTDETEWEEYDIYGGRKLTFPPTDGNSDDIHMIISRLYPSVYDVVNLRTGKASFGYYLAETVAAKLTRLKAQAKDFIK